MLATSVAWVTNYTIIYGINYIVKQIAVCFAKWKCAFVNFCIAHIFLLSCTNEIWWGAPYICLVYLFFILYKGDLVILGKGGSLDCFRGAVSPISATGSCQQHIYQHLSTTKTVTTVSALKVNRARGPNLAQSDSVSKN